MPPPTPVSIPSSAAMPGFSPNASAFCAPETTKSASPAASKMSTGLRKRSTAEYQWKMIAPGSSETAKYRQSLIAAAEPIRSGGRG